MEAPTPSFTLPIRIPNKCRFNSISGADARAGAHHSHLVFTPLIKVPSHSKSAGGQIRHEGGLIPGLNSCETLILTSSVLQASTPFIANL